MKSLVIVLIGMLMIGSIGIFSFDEAFAQGEWSVYIDDLPQGEFPNVDEMLELSSDYWTERDGTSFQRVYDENQADIAVYWVKNFGHETLGHELVQNINLGLGDEQCYGGWQPYSDYFVTSTMAHELGHAIGYDHANDPNDLMYFESSFYEYQTESHTITSIPGHSYFIPVCTFYDSTQYQYEVSVDNNAFSFNTYFVPSSQEFDKHRNGEDIQIYQGCIKENSNYVRDYCNVGAGSGLIVSLIDGPENQLAEISINLQEISGNEITQTSPTSEIVKEEPTKAPPSYSPNIPENTLISNEWLTLEQKIFSLSEFISPTIVLEGNVKQFGTSSSQKLILSIIKPDGSYEQLHILVNRELGNFSTVWMLKSDSPPGVYHISGKYNKVDLPPIFFTVSDASSSVASEVFSSNITTEEMSVWEMNEFFINYPSNWTVETDYEITYGETGMLSIVDDINFWNVQVNVNYIQDALTGENINDFQYIEELIQYHSDSCTSGQESLDMYGYFCSNFSVIDSKTFLLNSVKAHQISYSWKEMYSDGTYYDNTTVVTEIPRGEDLWEIYTETFSSSYSSFLPTIDDVISTFVLKSVSAQPVNSPSIPSTAQQTGIFVNTDKGTYVEGDQITISGHVDAVSSLPTVTIQIKAPNGNLVRIDQPSINSFGNFQTSFQVGGTMKMAGTYTIQMMYGSDSTTTVFEFNEITQPTSVPAPAPTSTPPQIEESPEISEGITARALGSIMGVLVIIGIPIIVIVLMIRKLRRRRRSGQEKVKEPEVDEPEVELKPKPSNLPIITKTWDIFSRADPSNINTVSVGINYTNSFVDSTWHTGGLHEIKDGASYGEYCLTLNQSSPQTQIMNTFEISLPLYGWSHSETEGLHVYEMRVSSSTLDESKLFFNKACDNFERELKKIGYNVRLL